MKHRKIADIIKSRLHPKIASKLAQARAAFCGNSPKSQHVRHPKIAGIFALILCLQILSGCAGASRYYGGFNTVPKASFGTIKPSTPATMRPYTVAGVRYYPAHVNIGDTQTGIASWYGPGFHGKLTSNGERFDTHSLTAAHKTMPMNTIVRVDNLENGSSVTVRINDRGPFVAGRIIDLSNAAAHAIKMTQKGTARVRISVVGFANANSNAAKYNSSVSSQQSAKKELQNIAANAAKASANAFVQTAQTQLAEKIDNSPIGAASKDFMLQIAAFKSALNAKAFAAKQNHSAYSAKVINSPDGLYKVVLQGFKSEKEASDFAASMKLLGAIIFKDN